MNELRCEHLVFAGNGMAGVACVEELLKSGQVFDITIFGTNRTPIMIGRCSPACWLVSATPQASR